jgi:hypothetical protein
MPIGVNSGIGYDALTKKVTKKPAFTTSQGTTPSSGIMNILNTRASQAGMGASAIGRAIQSTQPRVSNPADAVKAQMQPAAPSQFSYDPNTDPVYQKALTQARANAQSASGDAMAALNKRGILDSTITSDRVAGIQQDAVSNVDANLLPQLSAQAFQRYQDAENQKNQADQLAIQQGQLTGYYQSPEMKQQYAIVDQAKQDYANAKTPEERIAAHQRAEQARGALEQMNANSSLVGSDVTLDQARGNTSKFGVQTLEGQRNAYDMSANNPANQAAILSNKIDQLKLDNMPAQMKLELEQLQQQVNSGKLDAKTAEYNFNELTNPKSITNQVKAMELKLKQMDVSNTSTQNALEVQKLKKQISQIGKTQPKSSYEEQMNQVKLDTAKEKLKQLISGGNGSGSESKAQVDEDYKSDYADFASNPSEAYSWISDPANAKDVIEKYGTSKYQELMRLVTPKK